MILASGVKGGLSITSSRTEVNLGAAIYVSLDASAEQILNNIINYLTYGFKLGIPDVQFHLGPVPAGVAHIPAFFCLCKAQNPHTPKVSAKKIPQNGKWFILRIGG